MTMSGTICKFLGHHLKFGLATNKGLPGGSFHLTEFNL